MAEFLLCALSLIYTVLLVLFCVMIWSYSLHPLIWTFIFLLLNDFFQSYNYTNRGRVVQHPIRIMVAGHLLVMKSFGLCLVINNHLLQRSFLQPSPCFSPRYLECLLCSYRSVLPSSSLPSFSSPLQSRARVYVFLSLAALPLWPGSVLLQ